MSLDIAKGIGIVLVVLGHALEGLNSSAFFYSNGRWPSITIFVIYLFHMPLFFVVSGYLASLRHRPAGTTIKKLVLTIVYPYFLWSIFEGLVLVGLNGYTNSHTSIKVLYEILWNPIVPFWFLYSLFCCHVLYVWLRRYAQRIQIGFAVLFFLVPIYIEARGTIPYPVLSQTAKGFLFFMVAANFGYVIKKFGRWTAIAASILFALLAILQYQSQMEGALGDTTQIAPAFVGIVATIAWSRLLAAKQSGIVRALAFWGRYSMSIYVMHIFVTAAVRIGLQRLKVPSWNAQGGEKGALAVLLELGLATLLGILMPLAVNRVVSWMNLDKWFGLQNMELNRRPAAEGTA